MFCLRTLAVLQHRHYFALSPNLLHILTSPEVSKVKHIFVDTCGTQIFWEKMKPLTLIVVKSENFQQIKPLLPGRAVNLWPHGMRGWPLIASCLSLYTWQTETVWGVIHLMVSFPTDRLFPAPSFVSEMPLSPVEPLGSRFALTTANSFHFWQLTQSSSHIGDSLPGIKGSLCGAESSQHWFVEMR